MTAKELLAHKAKHIDRNKAIKAAYLRIYKETRALLSSIEAEPLRQILLREDKSIDERDTIVHELIAPLIYLSLTADSIGDLHIRYGYEQTEPYTNFYPITSAFIRLVYKLTMADATPVNIENCVATDWVITNCAELFEYIGDRNKSHIVKQLQYKPLTGVTKERVAVG
jgi:hypothetical protein